MQLTRVVNLHKASCDVYIGRPSIFGNPFHAQSDADRLGVIEQFRTYFLDRVKNDSEFRSEVEKLRGKVLGCHCVPKFCHGHIIAAYLNGELGG
jgi:hypothetical protein